MSLDAIQAPSRLLLAEWLPRTCGQGCEAAVAAGSRQCGSSDVLSGTAVSRADWPAQRLLEMP